MKPGFYSVRFSRIAPSVFLRSPYFPHFEKMYTFTFQSHLDRYIDSMETSYDLSDFTLMSLK